MWPVMLDMTKLECKKSLRALELDAYSSVVSAFRAQGDLNEKKLQILQELQVLFRITIDRHKSELRRAINDEKLYTIAKLLTKSSTNGKKQKCVHKNWSLEAKRLIPVLPRLPPNTYYTLVADHMQQDSKELFNSLLEPSETNCELNKNIVTMDNNKNLPKLATKDENLMELSSGVCVNKKNVFVPSTTQPFELFEKHLSNPDDNGIIKKLYEAHKKQLESKQKEEQALQVAQQQEQHQLQQQKSQTQSQKLIVQTINPKQPCISANNTQSTSTILPNSPQTSTTATVISASTLNGVKSINLALNNSNVKQVVLSKTSPKVIILPNNSQNNSNSQTINVNNSTTGIPYAITSLNSSTFKIKSANTLSVPPTTTTTSNTIIRTQPPTQLTTTKLSTINTSTTNNGQIQKLILLKSPVTHSNQQIIATNTTNAPKDSNTSLTTSSSSPSLTSLTSLSSTKTLKILTSPLNNSFQNHENILTSSINRVNVKHENNEDHEFHTDDEFLKHQQNVYNLIPAISPISTNLQSPLATNGLVNGLHHEQHNQNCLKRKRSFSNSVNIVNNNNGSLLVNTTNDLCNSACSSSSSSSSSNTSCTLNSSPPNWCEQNLNLINVMLHKLDENPNTITTKTTTDSGTNSQQQSQETITKSAEPTIALDDSNLRLLCETIKEKLENKSYQCENDLNNDMNLIKEKYVVKATNNNNSDTNDSESTSASASSSSSSTISSLSLSSKLTATFTITNSTKRIKLLNNATIIPHQITATQNTTTDVP